MLGAAARPVRERRTRRGGAAGWPERIGARGAAGPAGAAERLCGRRGQRGRRKRQPAQDTTTVELRDTHGYKIQLRDTHGCDSDGGPETELRRTWREPATGVLNAERAPVL